MSQSVLAMLASYETALNDVQEIVDELSENLAGHEYVYVPDLLTRVAQLGYRARSFYESRADG